MFLLQTIASLKTFTLFSYSILLTSSLNIINPINVMKVINHGAFSEASVNCGCLSPVGFSWSWFQGPFHSSSIMYLCHHLPCYPHPNVWLSIFSLTYFLLFNGHKSKHHMAHGNSCIVWAVANAAVPKVSNFSLTLEEPQASLLCGILWVIPESLA